MTLVEGLSAASAAIGIVKELRDIDRSIDDATFRLKIAELTVVLADTKIALSEAKLAISEKETNIRELEAHIVDLSSGETCPVCNVGRLKTVKVAPHPTSMLSKVGIKEKHLKCDGENCGHTENQLSDPSGILSK